MAHLVSNNVSPRKIAFCSKLTFELTEKTEIQVKLFVTRAVERADGGAGLPARRRRLVGVKNEFWGSVTDACLLGQDLAPHVLGASHHSTDKLAVLICGRARRIVCGGLLLLNLLPV
jgi:hypothetical protein